MKSSTRSSYGTIDSINRAEYKQIVSSGSESDDEYEQSIQHDNRKSQEIISHTNSVKRIT